MRRTLVRRIIAALVVVVGLGVGASAVPANAHPAGSVRVSAHPAPNDWQWD